MTHFVSAVTQRKLAHRAVSPTASRKATASPRRGAAPHVAATPGRPLDPAAVEAAGAALEQDIAGAPLRCATAAVAVAARPQGLGVSSPVEAAVPTTQQAARLSKRSVVWCGEQGGELTVRSVAGAVLKVIPGKPQAFVFCVAAVGDVVWAGLSDGVVRIFDSYSYGMLDEFRAHAAPVTAIAKGASAAVAEQPEGLPEGATPRRGRVVVTAGEDWAVAVWDPVALRTAVRAGRAPCLARFTLHSSAVRALAVERGAPHALCSGCADGTLRLWNLDTCAPGGGNAAAVTHMGWPVMAAHDGGVTAVAFCGYGGSAEAALAAVRAQEEDAREAAFQRTHGVKGLAASTAAPSDRRRGNNAAPESAVSDSDDEPDAVDDDAVPSHSAGASDVSLRRVAAAFVVSGGRDGAVRVWAKATGALLFDLEGRPCPISALHRDRTHRTLWVGGVDGAITVYDERTMRHRSTLQDHGGAYVAGFCPMPGATTTRCWALDGSGAVAAIDVGGAAAADHDAALSREQEAGGVIAGLRSQCVASYGELLELRERAAALEASDLRRRQGLAKAFAGTARGVAERYALAAGQFLVKHRRATHSAKVCASIMRLSEETARATAWRKWRLFWQDARDAQHNEFVACGLEAARRRATLQRVSLSLHRAAVLQEKRRRMAGVAQAFLNATDGGRRQTAFALWHRFQRERHAARAKSAVADALAGGHDKSIATFFWRRLVQAAQADRARAAKLRALNALLAPTAGMARLRLAFLKWRDAPPVLRAARNSVQSVDLFSRLAQTAIRRFVFERWVRFPGTKRAAAAAAARAELEEERAMWDALVLDGGHGAADANAARRARLEAEMHEVDADGDAIQASISAAATELARIEREETLLAEAKVDPGLDAYAQCCAVMDAAKARVVNCGADARAVAVARSSATLAAEGLARAPAAQPGARPAPKAAPKRGGTPVRRASSPGPGARRASTVPTMPLPPGTEVRPDAGLLLAVARLKERTFAFLRSDPPSSHRAPRAEAVVTGTCPPDAATDAEDPWEGRKDWGLTLAAAEDRVGLHDARDLSRCLLDVAVAFDVVRGTLAALEPPLDLPARRPPATEEEAHAAQTAAMGREAVVRDGVLQELLRNAAPLLVVARQFSRARRAAGPGAAWLEGPRASLVPGTPAPVFPQSQAGDPAAAPHPMQGAPSPSPAPSPVAAAAGGRAGARDLGFKVDPALQRGGGLKVARIQAGGPAAAAGLQEGDIVTRLGRTRLLDAAGYRVALSRLVATAKPGQQVPLSVTRGKEQFELSVAFV